MGGFEIKKSDQPILEHCFSILDSPFRDKIPLKKCYMWCVLQYGTTIKFRKSFCFYQNGIKNVIPVVDNVQDKDGEITYKII